MKYDNGPLLLVDMKTSTNNKGHLESGLIYQMNKNQSILLSDAKTAKVSY